MTLNQQATRRICPISLKEMGAGLGKMEMRWIYLSGCGCVLTEAGLKQVQQKGGPSECQICGSPQDDLKCVTINPTEAEEESMKIKLIEQRRLESELKEKRKLEKKAQKKRKVAVAQELETESSLRPTAVVGLDEASDAKNHRAKSKKVKVEVPTTKLNQEPTSSIASSSMSKITSEIQKETQQSLVNLSSSTLSSIYGPRDAQGKQLLGQQKESWMTRGTWTRYAA